LMIETDILYAHLKEDDRLKEDAETLLAAVDSGALGKVYASREALHELHYLLKRAGWPSDEALAKVGALTRIRNIEWSPTTSDTDLLALSLVSMYKLSSIFDAYHAATCLLADPECMLVSTDPAYDGIPQTRRTDPRELAERIRKKAKA
jgi:predicted nucleic acid-binding protein